MYSHLLDTFIIVAEEKSFNKAAERLFISHTAVIKQMNQLESIMETPLFSRSVQGIDLTPAGNVLLTGAPTLIQMSHDLVHQVRTANSVRRAIRLGASILYPTHEFLILWDHIIQKFPHMALEIIPIHNDIDILSRIGTDFDMIIGPYGVESTNRLVFQKLSNQSFAIALPRGHALSNRQELYLKDFSEGQLIMMQKGVSPQNDAIRQELEEKYPNLTIEDTHFFYTMKTFNTAAYKKVPLLSLQNWQHVHPDLITIPLNEVHTLPYGLIYLQDAPTHVHDCINYVNELVSQP